MDETPAWLRGTDFDFRHRVLLNVASIGAGVGAAWCQRAALGARGFWVDSPAMCLLAAATASLGIAVRAWATGSLPFGIIGDRALHAPRLVTAGPFGATRNPLYLGTWIAVSSFGWILNAAGLVVVAAAMAFKLRRLVDFEERRLREVFGADYDAYRRCVPRFVPRDWRAVRESIAVKSDWIYGLRGNVFLMGLVAGYALAVVRPSIGAVLVCGGLGLIAQWPMLRRERAAMGGTRRR